MLTFDETKEILDDLADELPAEIFDRLNGGVILVDDEMRNPEASGNIYIMGQYHYEPAGLGRYITINYGSFVRLYINASREVQVQELKKVLHHELTHHLESLAGDRSLERWDAVQMENFRRRYSGR